MSVYGRLLLQRTDLLSAVKVHTEECIVKSQTAVKQKNNIEFLTVRNLGSAGLLFFLSLALVPIALSECPCCAPAHLFTDLLEL